MSTLQKPPDVILKDGRNLQEVLEKHQAWANNESNGTRAKLQGEDLSNLDLSGYILHGIHCIECNFQGADLSNADFSVKDPGPKPITMLALDAHSTAWQRHQSNFAGSDLSCAILDNVDFSDALLDRTRFCGARLARIFDLMFDIPTFQRP